MPLNAQKGVKADSNITLTISGELCDLNAYLKALSNNRYGGGSIKKEETERVYYEIKKQKLSKVKDYPVHIEFIWTSKDNRKDIDNVGFAKKFILDGLVMAGILENDGRKQVTGFSDIFMVDKNNPRVDVIIDEPTWLEKKS